MFTIQWPQPVRRLPPLSVGSVPPHRQSDGSAGSPTPLRALVLAMLVARSGPFADAPSGRPGGTGLARAVSAAALARDCTGGRPKCWRTVVPEGCRPGRGAGTPLVAGPAAGARDDKGRTNGARMSGGGASARPIHCAAAKERI